MRTINYDKLLRQPNHKVRRLKFEKQKGECLKEQTNDPLTMEDKFKLNDMPWIQSLRFVQPEGDGSSKKKLMSLDTPPAFFEEDL